MCRTNAYSYNYSAPLVSTNFHPTGWSQAKGNALQAPMGHAGEFDWPTYLATTGATAVPPHLLSGGGGGAVVVGMKLEAVDVQNPLLTCVASVVKVEGTGAAAGTTITVSFDGWGDRLPLPARHIISPRRDTYIVPPPCV